MAAGCSPSDNLPDLGAIDQLNLSWKKSVTSCVLPATTENMAEQGGAHVAARPVPHVSGGYEATPDVEVMINIYYLNGQVKVMNGNLNPNKLIAQLRLKIAPQISLQPHLMDMTWSKKLEDGANAHPVSLDDNCTLRSYEVSTDDTIIIRELTHKPERSG